MKIPQVLEALGITPADLSRRIGVTRGAIAQWTKAGRIPKLRQLQIESLTGGKLRASPECDKFRVASRGRRAHAEAA